MITIIGTGVVGLTCADMLLTAGQQIKIITASTGVDDSLCSWWAGGMLAPYCEMESAEPLVGELAPISMAYWQDFCQRHADTCDHYINGTIVISPNRDQSMLTHFARRTQHWQKLSANELHQLEPVLSSHRAGLFYPTEGHIEPRQVLKALWQRINNSEHAEIITDTRLSNDEVDEITANQSAGDWLLDCRGYQAKSAIDIDSKIKNSLAKSSQLRNNQARSTLRGVRGEMLHLYNPELTLSRPIRLLHPRIPIYLVPRANQQFMIGATMIENGSRERASVRSVMELLSAVYAINPAFSQSEIVEIGVDVRPAYPDNLPQIIEETPTDGRPHKGKRLSVNGMYRHGYLLAPAFAKMVKDYVVDGVDNELIKKI